MADDHYLTLMELFTIATLMVSPWVLISWSLQLREILKNLNGRPFVAVVSSIVLLLVTSFGTTILSLIILKLAPVTALSLPIPPWMHRYIPAATFILPGFLSMIVVTIAVFWFFGRLKNKPSKTENGVRDR